MEKQGESNTTMQHPLHVVFGNEVRRLAEKLGDELFASSSHPFENRLVIVPDTSVKDFLFYCFAEHPRLKIAAGVQILPLNQAVMEILDSLAAKENRKRIPSFLELTLAIEEKLLSEWKSQFPSLLQYVDAGHPDRMQKRTSTLSDELARLFSRYGLYGQKFLPKWLEDGGWQQALWREIFSNDSNWTFPLEALSAMKIEKYQGKIALFGFSHLSLAHLAFFSSIPASLYQLSPCALFWQDATSDKERLFTKRFLQKKGVGINTREEIEGYMEAGHPLLGNWGKLGREMLKSLDCFVLNEEEAYLEPSENSLLSQLKRSLLTLEPLAAEGPDESIQLHSATSKLREVEIMRDVLESLLHRHTQADDPIMPREICVVSPDISSYAPYIQMVFQQSRFAFVIEGIPLSSASVAVQGFLQLLKLPEERFALSSFEKILRSSSFMQKNGFASDEVFLLSKWLKSAQVRRGLTQNPNSWEEGIDRLLYGLALIPDAEGIFETWSNEIIPQSEIELFSRFLELFSEMRSDLEQLQSHKSASEWLEFFLRVAEKYFQWEWEDELFFQELKSLAFSCRIWQAQVWSFESISRILHHLAQKPAGEVSQTNGQLQKIIFTSMKAGNLSSARILWCLGMDEGAFPRNDARSSLCEMSRLKSGDYFPLKVDEDRALFLEMFLRAQDYLIFSYQRIHAEDGKHQGPSLLIEELDHHCGGIVRTEHPAFAFDQSYYVEEAKVKKWAPSDYLAAQAYYFSQRKSSLFFAAGQRAIELPQEIFIDIRQLKKLASNPLKFYFNETLKIYLKEDEDEEETEFLISHLRKSMLRKMALHSNLAQVLQPLKAQGKLPRGLFQDAALQGLEIEMRDLQRELKAFDVRPDEIRSVQFSASCSDREKSEDFLPPLVVELADGRKAYITGTLDDLCPKGLLFHGEKDFKSLVRAFPLYLIYRCLHKEQENAQLLLTKKGLAVPIAIDDPQAELAAYLDYFLLAKQTPSPLLPEWAKSLLMGGIEDFKTALTKDPNYDDPYLAYLKRRQGLFDPDQTFLFWASRLRTIFDPIIRKD